MNKWAHLVESDTALRQAERRYITRQTPDSFLAWVRLGLQHRGPSFVTDVVWRADWPQLKRTDSNGVTYMLGIGRTKRSRNLAWKVFYKVPDESPNSEPGLVTYYVLPFKNSRHVHPNDKRHVLTSLRDAIDTYNKVVITDA